jgi:hypothetical protein
MIDLLTDPAILASGIFVAWTAFGTALLIAVGDR